MRKGPFLFVLAAALTAGCGNSDAPTTSDLPAIPTAHDPNGADIDEGVVLAATEESGGIRLIKVLHVDDFPKPLDWEYHMMAFEPKAQTWEEAARLWKDKKVKIVLKRFTVRRTNFLTRDYRVLFKEPLTAEEREIYEASKRTYPSER
ncbi:MAG: hypothetical protein R3F14_01740 [Polyangiaceae bacterium]